MPATNVEGLSWVDERLGFVVVLRLVMVGASILISAFYVLKLKNPLWKRVDICSASTKRHPLEAAAATRLRTAAFCTDIYTLKSKASRSYVNEDCAGTDNNF
jgi:hypothetical protein